MEGTRSEALLGARAVIVTSPSGHPSAKQKTGLANAKAQERLHSRASKVESNRNADEVLAEQEAQVLSGTAQSLALACASGELASQTGSFAS